MLEIPEGIVPGTRLKSARTAAGLSRKELDEKSGVGHDIIKAYEIGRRNINLARVDIVKALSKALNCSIEDLLDY